MRTNLICALILVPLLFTGCKKKYRVSVANYYLLRLDSVVIGNRAVIFTDIAPETRTDYREITSGEHSVRFYPPGEGLFYGTAKLPRNGPGGDHTIQVDGLKQVSVFQD